MPEVELPEVEFVVEAPSLLSLVEPLPLVDLVLPVDLVVPVELSAANDPPPALVLVNASSIAEDTMHAARNKLFFFIVLCFCCFVFMTQMLYQSRSFFLFKRAPGGALFY